MTSCVNGHEVPSGQKFCGRCGARAERVLESPAAPTAPESRSGRVEAAVEQEDATREAVADWSARGIRRDTRRDRWRQLNPGQRRSAIVIIVLAAASVVAVLAVVGGSLSDSRSSQETDSAQVAVTAAAPTPSIAAPDASQAACVDDISNTVDATMATGVVNPQYVYSRYGAATARTYLVLRTATNLLAQATLGQERYYQALQEEGDALRLWCEANSQEYGY